MSGWRRGKGRKSMLSFVRHELSDKTDKVLTVVSLVSDMICMV